MGDDPEPSTSALTYELLAPIAPVAPRAWLAALGLLGDLGDAARRHPLVAAAARQPARRRRGVSGGPVSFLLAPRRADRLPSAIEPAPSAPRAARRSHTSREV
ncbi:hypothetical protein WMF38_24785 [Sorangium sp. So ce118]